MQNRLKNNLLGGIRHVVSTLELRTEPDQELLRRFVSQRDEAAFTAIVRRHGPMVMRVAVRTLQNEHDAEDVFQATFLVLSQKAQSLRRQGSLGSWLYGIAYRIALKAKATAGGRRNREQRVTPTPMAGPLAQITVQEAQTILDQELHCLPEQLREPVVLCCLEGLARDEAAQRIGCSAGVLKSRLERGREHLRLRLIARGLTLPCGLGAFLLLECTAGAGVPTPLVMTTVKAAVNAAAGGAVTSVVTAEVAALTEGVMKAMLFTKLKAAIAVVVILGVVVTGATILTYRAAARQDDKKPIAIDKPPIAEQPVADLAPPQSKAAKTDLERLHGAWTLVEMETRGKKLTGKNMTFSGAPLRSLKLAVDGEHFPDLGAIPEEQVTDPKSPRGGVDVQFGGYGPIKGEFVLNETKKPKQITMGGFLLNWESIYKLEGNTLTICFNPKNHIRPDEFRTMADSDRVLFVFKRDAAEVQEKNPAAKAEKHAAQAQEKKDPPKDFTNSIGMKFVWIKPGSFMMGSPKEEKEGKDNESQHKVTLTKGFYIGVYAVTQEQWKEVMGNNPSFFKGEKNLPVEQVSWNDCQEFINKLREKDKKWYRLPSESEWEFCCRAGTKTPFHFGETISTDQANYNGNFTYGDGKKGTFREKTTPVGSFLANAWGLHDMHGNVLQWCQDWYGDYPQKDVVDPTGAEKGEHRVLRGGAWDRDPENCRSALRRRNAPDGSALVIGLRVCFCLD